MPCTYSLLSRFLPALLVHAAVGLVLPWRRVARKRLHIQHLVFSSQRAANERLRGSDAKQTICESSCVEWRSGLCSSNTHGFTIPCQHSAEGQSQAWPLWVTFIPFTASCPTPFWQLFAFFCWLLFFLNANIFSGTKLGFSLILCTSMDTSGSVVSMRAEEQSFHVRYR